MSAFIPGDIVSFSWWSDLQRYSPRVIGQTSPKFQIKIKRGEMGLVLSVDDNTKEMLILFSESKLVIVYSWMLSLVIDREAIRLLKH